MDDRTKEGFSKVAVLGTEEALGAGLALLGAMTGPLGAVSLPILGKVLGGLVRHHSAERAAQRVEAVSASLAEALVRYDFTFEELHALDDSAAETLFQSYRRAIDAAEPTVVPALGKLAAMALRDGRDRFFVSAGRMLEQMTAAEFAVGGHVGA